MNKYIIGLIVILVAVAVIVWVRPVDATKGGVHGKPTPTLTPPGGVNHPPPVQPYQ